MPPNLSAKNGDPWRNRTSNLLIKSQLLYLVELTGPDGDPSRASHWSGTFPNLVRPAGLEPATCGFEVRRSIQLSYGRIFLSEEKSSALMAVDNPTSKDQG